MLMSKCVWNICGQEECRSCGKGVLAKESNTTNLFNMYIHAHHPTGHAEAAQNQPKRVKSQDTDDLDESFYLGFSF